MRTGWSDPSEAVAWLDKYGWDLKLGDIPEFSQASLALPAMILLLLRALGWDVAFVCPRRRLLTASTRLRPTRLQWLHLLDAASKAY